MNVRLVLVMICGLFTGVIIWFYLENAPQQGGPVEPTGPVVVAARDLGAGETLDGLRLAVAQVPVSQIPEQAYTDPAALHGRTLAVVRFAGEEILPNMLGPAVQLQAHERGLLIRISDITGLAGLVGPGETVGLMALITDQQSPTRDTVAKYLFGSVRLVWLSPEFRFQPGAGGGESGRRTGLAMVALDTRPAPILYARQSTLYARALRAGIEDGTIDAEAQGLDAATLDALEQPPDVLWGIPLEMVGALSAAGGQFTFLMEPPNAREIISPGATTYHLTLPIWDILSETAIVSGQAENGRE